MPMYVCKIVVCMTLYIHGKMNNSISRRPNLVETQYDLL